MMFNLIVKGNGWANARDTMYGGRVFEYTETHLVNQFKPDGVLDFDKLIRLPTLFVEESNGVNDKIAHIGKITRARIVDRDISLEYIFDTTLPSILNSVLERIAGDLQIQDFQFIELIGLSRKRIYLRRFSAAFSRGGTSQKCSVLLSLKP